MRIEASNALMYFYLRQDKQNTYEVTLWRVRILLKQSCATATYSKATM